MDKTISLTLKQIRDCLAKLEKVKPLYDKIDQLTLSLVGKKLPETIEVNGQKYEVILSDNFAERNTAFRQAAVKRWELKLKPIAVAPKKKHAPRS